MSIDFLFILHPILVEGPWWGSSREIYLKDIIEYGTSQKNQILNCMLIHYFNLFAGSSWKITSADCYKKKLLEALHSDKMHTKSTERHNYTQTDAKTHCETFTYVLRFYESAS